MQQSTDLTPLPNFNMKLLQTFILVAEQGSFRSAAQHSYRSQSAISAQIKLLEEQLGIVLFHRTTRMVELTREGEELLRGAKRALEEMTFSLRVVEETVRLGRGHVSIACAPTVAAGALPHILAVFEKDYPTVRVSIREMPSELLLESVRQREVDFAVGQVVPTEAELGFEIILDDAIVALASRKLIPESGNTIPLCSLSTYPLLLLDRVTAFRRMFDKDMHDAGLDFSAKYECFNSHTLISMAEAGLGVAVLPQSVFSLTRPASTSILRITEPDLKRQVALIREKGRSLTPAAARLANLIREMMGPKAGSSRPA